MFNVVVVLQVHGAMIRDSTTHARMSVVYALLMCLFRVYFDDVII
jgi:hypothetical protein